jgi:hypothetical protein
LPPFPLPPVSALTTLCLAQRHAPLLTIGHKKSFLFRLTQDALALHLLAEAFEQILL